MTPSRLEAFSDGVLAIAMTLLVLDLKVPGDGEAEAGLAHYLGHQWPSYVAFLSSFLVVGIIWLNHHATLRLLAFVDHGIQVRNLMLLLAISVIPFPTALLADYVAGAHSVADQRIAVLVYGGSSTLMSVTFNLLWRRVLARPELHQPWVQREQLTTRNRRYNIGLTAYPLLTLLGLINRPAFLVGMLLLAALYLLPTPEQEG